MSDLDLALPMPPDICAATTDAACALERARAWAEGTSLSRRHGLVPLLSSTWSGPAAEAARAEAGTAGRQCQDLVGSFAAPAAALRTFAAEVASTRAAVAGLREQWQQAERLERLRLAALTPEDPTAPAITLAAHRECDRTQAELQARHAQHLARLRQQQTLAAAIVRDAAGGTGTGGATRRSLLDRLPLTDGAIRAGQARALVAGLLDGMPPQPASWGEREWDRIGTLGERVADPYVALALVERLGVSALAAALRAGRWDRADAARRHLAPLGTAVVSALSSRAESDPAWRQRRDRLAEDAVCGPRERLADLVELMGLGTGRVAPQAAVLVGAMRALLREDPVAADHPIIPPAEPPADALGARGPVDAVGELLELAGRDPTVARAVLLADDGPGTDTVLHRLVVDRPLAHAGTGAILPSSVLLSRLLVDLAAVPDHALAAHRLDEEFARDLGAAALASWDLKDAAAPNVARHLAPFGLAAADLLVREPQRVAAALFTVDTADRRGDAIARMQGLLGQVGTATFFQLHDGSQPTPVRRVTDAVVDYQAGLLSAAPVGVARDQGTVDVGEAAGFVVGSAVLATDRAAARLDEVLESMRRALDLVAAAVPLPDPTSRTGTLAVTAVASEPVRSAVLDLVTKDVPADAQARARVSADRLADTTSDIVRCAVARSLDPAGSGDPEARRLTRLADAAIADGIRARREAPTPLPAR